MKPTEEYLEEMLKFDRYSPQKWALWLRKALESNIIDGEGIEGFYPFEHFMLPQRAPLWAGLQEIYESCREENARNIRQATGLLLSQLPVQAEYEAIFLILLEFVIAIKAKELLGYIPRHTNQGFRRLSPALDAAADRAFREIGTK